MSHNPREPSDPAGDNPAGRTRGQTHRFHSDFRSNPELTADPGRPPVAIPTTISTTNSQFAMPASGETVEPAGGDPFARSGAVYHSPTHTTSVHEQQLQYSMSGENTIGTSLGIVTTKAAQSYQPRNIMEDTNLTNVTEMGRQSGVMADLGGRMYGAMTSRHQQLASRTPSMDG